MNTRNAPQPESLDPFEQKLLGELRTVVAERAIEGSGAPKSSPRRPRPPVLARRPVRLVAAAALVAAGGIGASLWAGGGGTAAYALGTDANGDITVTINKPEGAEALEQALAAKGIKADVTFLPDGKMCEGGRYESGGGSGSVTFGVSGTDTSPVMTISKGMVGSGETFVLEASGPDAKTLAIAGGVAKGKVAPCVPTDVDMQRPAPNGPIPGNPGQGVSTEAVTTTAGVS